MKNQATLERPTTEKSIAINENERNAEHHSSVLALLALPVLAFSRALAGPPMTERDRINAALAESRIRNSSGFYR